MVIPKKEALAPRKPKYAFLIIVLRFYGCFCPLIHFFEQYLSCNCVFLGLNSSYSLSDLTFIINLVDYCFSSLSPFFSFFSLLTSITVQFFIDALA